MKKGFTLLELIVVIIILGILAALGFAQYTKMVEKGRTAEAKTILGQIRAAQNSYWQEYRAYDAGANISVVLPVCDADHYFVYTTENVAGLSTATRCSGGGKVPDVGGAEVYVINLSVAGQWSGTAGYF